MPKYPWNEDEKKEKNNNTEKKSYPWNETSNSDTKGSKVEISKVKNKSPLLRTGVTQKDLQKNMLQYTPIKTQVEEKPIVKPLPTFHPAQQKVYEEMGQVVPNKHVDAYHPIRNWYEKYPTIEDYQRGKGGVYDALYTARNLVKSGKLKLEELPPYVQKDLIAEMENTKKMDEERWQKDKEYMDNIKNPVGKFLERTSRVASNTFLGGTNYNQVNPAKGIVDLGSDVAGTLIGYATNMPGGTSQLGIANNLAGEPVENAVSKLTSKLSNTNLANRAINKIAPMAARGAVEGATLGGLQGYAQGLDANDIKKKMLVEGATGAVLDPLTIGAGHVLGKGINNVLDIIRKRFDLPKELEAEIKRNIGAFSIDADGNVFSKLDKEGNVLETPRLIRKLNKGGGGDIVSAEGNKFVDQYGNVKGTTETTELLKPGPTPKILYPQANEYKTLSKTIGESEKVITEFQPFENVVNKVSVKKDKITESINDNPLLRGVNKIKEKYDIGDEILYPVSKNRKIKVVGMNTDGRYLVKDIGEDTSIKTGTTILSKEDIDKYVSKRGEYIEKINKINKRDYETSLEANKEESEKYLGEWYDNLPKGQKTIVGKKLGGESVGYYINGGELKVAKPKKMIEDVEPFIVRAESNKIDKGKFSTTEYKLYFENDTYIKANKAEYDYFNFIRENGVPVYKGENLVPPQILKENDYPLSKYNNTVTTSTTTQKGLQATQKLLPSTLKEVPQKLSQNKPNNTLLRIEEPTVTQRASVDKPHGIYTTFDKYDSPHQLGGNKYYWEKNPDAKVLDVTPFKIKSNRKDIPIETGTGVYSTAKFLGKEEAEKLMAMPKKELSSYLKSQYPNVEWNKYYDQQDMVEGLGGILARKNGYDAIQGLDKIDPEFSEYVILTEKGAKPIDKPIAQSKTPNKPIKADLAKRTIKQDPNYYYGTKPDPNNPLKVADQYKREAPNKMTISEVRALRPNTIQNASKLPTLNQNSTSSVNTPPKLAKSLKGDIGAKEVAMTSEKIPLNSKERGFPQNVKNDATTPERITKGLNKTKLTYEPISNQGTLDKVLKQVEDNPTEALTNLLTDTNKRLNADDVATGELLIKRAFESGDDKQAYSIISTLAERLTEAGQAIQAASMFKKMTPEGMLMYAEKTISKANREIDKVIDPIKLINKNYYKKGQLTDELRNSIKSNMEEAMQLPEGREKIVKMAQIMQTISEAMPKSPGTKLESARTIAMLSNPKTWVRNIVGNATFGGVEAGITKPLSTLIDKGLKAKTGQRTVANTDFRKLGEGLKKGTKDAFSDYKLGIDTSPTRGMLEIPRSNEFKNVPGLNQLEKLVKLGVSGGDRPFYEASYKDALSEQLKLHKINTGAVLETATDEMKQAAEEVARYRTYADNNMISESLSQVKRGLNRFRVAGIGAGDVLMKFTKTPANLLARGIDYSPAGLIKGMVDVSKVLSGNKDVQRKAAEGLSRGVIGTGFVTAAIAFSNMGIMRGKRAKSTTADELEKATGRGQYTVNTSALERFISSGFNSEMAKSKTNDTIQTYDWAQPLALSAGTGANISEDLKRKQKVDALNLIGIVVESLESGVNTIVEQPMLQNISRVFKGGNPVEGLMSVVQSYPASFVPAFLQGMRYAVDDTLRDTRGSFLESTGKQVLNKIPGASKKLTASIDVLGKTRKVTATTPINRLIDGALNPSKTTKIQGDSTTEAIMSLYNSTNDGHILPNYVEKTQTIPSLKKGESPKELTVDQRNQYQKILADEYMKLAGPIINRLTWGALSQEKKLELLTSARNKSDSIAKKKMQNIIFGR